MSTSKRRHNVSDDDSSDELGVLESEPDRKIRKYSKDTYIAKFPTNWLTVPDFKPWLTRNPAMAVSTVDSCATVWESKTF